MTTTNHDASARDELGIIDHMRGEVMGSKKPTGLNLFLVWGYPTVIVFIMEFAVLMFLHKHWYEWLWVGIPLIGVPLKLHFDRKDYDRTGHRTHEANSIRHLWFYIGAASALLGFTTGFTELYPVCYNLMQSLLIGLGAYLTGVVSRFRPMTVCSIIGSLLAFVCLFLQDALWPWQFLVTAFVTVIALIIPGHMLKHYVLSYS